MFAGTAWMAQMRRRTQGASGPEFRKPQVCVKKVKALTPGNNPVMSMHTCHTVMVALCSPIMPVDVSAAGNLPPLQPPWLCRLCIVVDAVN